MPAGRGNVSLAVRLGLAWLAGIVLVAGSALITAKTSTAGLSIVCALGAIPALFFLTVGAQCLFAARQNRLQRSVAAGGRQWTGVWWRESLRSMQIFGLWQVALWRTPPDRLEGIKTGYPGVVFVHGFMCNRGLWRLWMQELDSEQRAFVAVNLEPVYGSIDGYSSSIQAAVELMIARTGVTPVVVCHSMGGLAVRAWLRRVGPQGLTQVRRIITLGTPHRGTWMARFGHARNAREMRQGSPWLTALQQEQPPGLGAYLTCWYSNCDNIVFPALTAVHDGAESRMAPARGHLELATDAYVREQCLAQIRSLSPESAVTSDKPEAGKVFPGASQ